MDNTNINQVICDSEEQLKPYQIAQRALDRRARMGYVTPADKYNPIPKEPSRRDKHRMEVAIRKIVK